MFEGWDGKWFYNQHSEAAQQHPPTSLVVQGKQKAEANATIGSLLSDVRFPDDEVRCSQNGGDDEDKTRFEYLKDPDFKDPKPPSESPRSNIYRIEILSHQPEGEIWDAEVIVSEIVVSTVSPQHRSHVLGE